MKRSKSIGHDQACELDRSDLNCGLRSDRFVHDQISKKGNRCDTNRRALKPQIQRATFAMNFEANAHSPSMATSLFATAVATTKKDDIVTLSCNHPDYRPEYELDSFMLGGLKYHRVSKIEKSGRQPRRLLSVAWQHGELLLREKDHKQVYYCYLCEKQQKKQLLFINNEGSKPALNHLARTHKIDSKGAAIEASKDAEQNISPAVFNVVWKYNFEDFKRLLIRWIVYCQVALVMLENRYFRELISFLNKGLGDMLPRASSTLRRWILAEYSKHKLLLKEDMQLALSNVHISFDMWSSPNSYAIVSVYGHFIDKRGIRRTELLGFRRLYGDHSGENQAATLLEVVKEYEIEVRIGYLVCDNAKSNDTAVDAVIKELYPHLTAKQRKARRLRCFGHVTNLCARAMLLGKGAGKAMEEVSWKTSKGAFDAVDQFWRGRGAIGRLHNLIKYIRWTPQRREQFDNCKGDHALGAFDHLQLIQDNSTRWNSFYYAIQRSLDLKDRINKFCKEYKPTDKRDTTIKDNLLTHSHWHQLDRLEDCLKLFEVSTSQTQGIQRPLSDWYPTLLWMLDEICIFKDEFSEENDSTFEYLAQCCSHAWYKAEKYFKLSDQMPIIYAAVMLDPRTKAQWFVDKWQEKGPTERRWIAEVTAAVKEIWRSDYCQTKTMQAPMPTRGNGENTLHERLSNFKKPRLSSSAAAVDPLDEYLQTDCLPWDTPTTPLQWWLDRRHNNPELAKFAFDTLAIPLMSDAPERSFSAGRDLITYRRSCLHDDIIEACACLRSWYGIPESQETVFDEEEEIETDFGSY